LIMRISPSACTPDTLRGLLERGVTGIVGENTGLVGAIMEAAVALERVIPRDLSVATLGDPMTTAEAIPAKTTFLIPRQEMGAQAVRLLIDNIWWPSGEPRSVEHWSRRHRPPMRISCLRQQCAAAMPGACTNGVS
jgi:DNA-binding LacI/PurR family transcriptional regulator